jgi:LysM repeat protein
MVIPMGVISVDENIDISINDSFKSLNFEQAQGSDYNLLINISNKSNDERVITLKTIGESAGLDILFFDEVLDDKYKEKLSQNDNNVVGLCENEVIQNEISEWCRGLIEIKLKIPGNSNLKIHSIISIDDEATDKNIEIVALNDEDVVESQFEILYKVPNKGIKKLSLEKFAVTKNSDSEYSIDSVVSNVGTEIVKYNFCTIVKSLWIGEEVKTCHDDDIKVAEEKSQKYDIAMPKFGKMVVSGGIEYIDNNGQLQQKHSNYVEIFVWSKQIVVGGLIAICFCSIFVLLYKYINKNMFGFNKKKKENKIFTEEYIVKDADNMISIAQSYDIPWKELAQINEIEPPYVLISGETILVPGDEDVTEENSVEDNDDLDYGDEKEHVRTIGTSAQLNQNQKNMQVEAGIKIDDVQNKEMMNDDVIQEHDQNQIIKDGNSDVDGGKKDKSQTQSKRKVTYAAPENMLSKPASEPTTSAIDIEWMQDDEEMYADEMQMQEKRMNTKIILVSIFGIICVGLVVWWVAMIFINNENKEDVSVDNLIEQNVESEDVSEVGDVIVENEGTKDLVNSENSNEEEVNEDNVKSGDSGEEKKEKLVGDTDVSNIKIQVLNAGAKTGAAGSVTSEFKDGGYKTNNATNATNDYNGVVIYYSSEQKDHLDGVLAKVSDEYGNKKTEESNEVVDKYDADFVIVLGT